MSLPRPELPLWATIEPATAGAWGPPDLISSAGENSPVRADSIDLAYAKGFEDGFNEGTRRTREALQPVRQAFGAAIGTVEGELVLIRKSGEANLAALALIVARWLFQREVEVSPEILAGLVRRAIGLLPTGVPIEVVAHPSDLESLSGELELKEPDGRPLPIHWAADPTLDRGSFRLVTAERLVDGRVDVALRSLYERLVDQ